MEFRVKSCVPRIPRSFSVHYLLPFIVSLLVILHLDFLHEQKSSSPLGIQKAMDKIPFHPYFMFKDLIRIRAFIFMLLIVKTQNPFFLIDPENFTPADPLSTPVHIQPEWYFLFANAILRSVPNKLGGVIALVLSILILMPLAMSNNTTQYIKCKPILKLFWISVLVFLLSTWLCPKPVVAPCVSLGKALTIAYFSGFMTHNSCLLWA